MKTLSLSVAIPALNEEANIGRILNSLVHQKVESAAYKYIYVLSDGSRDNTVEIAKSIKSKKIVIKEFRTRKGKSFRLNQLFKSVDEDIVVVFDADVQPENEYLLEKLAKKIVRDSKIGIVSGDTISYPGKTFIERVISYSHEFKTDIYRHINNGSNVYLCHGRIRAFSRLFYKSLQIPADCPEDAYSYLTCVDRKHKFVYLPSASVFFYSPRTLDDHVKQSTRFYTGQKSLKNYFDSKVLSKEYAIPAQNIALAIIKGLIDSPLYLISYIFLNVYIHTIKNRVHVDQSLWDIVTTSKGEIV